MKKLFLLLVLSVILFTPVYSAQAQTTPIDPCADPNPPQGCPSNPFPPPPYGTYYCPDGRTPIPRGGVCPPSTRIPPNTNNPPTGGTSSGSQVNDLPECVDNYDTATICLPKSPFPGAQGIAGSGSLTELASQIVKILLYFAGIVAVIFVIVGGYRYMTAGGNEETAGKGRKTMTQAIIGLVIVILAYVIVTAVTNYLTK